MKRILWIALAALLVAACGGKKSRPAQSSARPAPRTFRAVTVPSTVPPEERRAYLRDHYWDNFDFRDTTLLAEVDTVAMVRALFAYVANFVAPDDRAAIDTLMRRASASKPMTEYFAMLAERVLHDPNSPARNDELYIPGARSAGVESVARPLGAHRASARSAHGLPEPDRPTGQRFPLYDGRRGDRRMYDIRAEYLLLFINNPGCNMCKTVREAISASPMLNELIERGKLKVLALFPDEDLTEWQEYRPQIPARWINAYDKGCVVRDRELYDLKAIPALYLLDRRQAGDGEGRRRRGADRVGHRPRR